MSHGSLKETVKALHAAFAGDAHTLTPLPDELHHTIEAFLERNPHPDDGEAQRLHDELLSLHNKYIAATPDKLGPFVHVLRLLQPAIRGEKRLEDWWLLVIRPVVDAIGHRRDTVDDAREFLLGVLLFDPDDDPNGEHAALSAKFVSRVLEAYMGRCKVPTLESDEILPEDEFVAQELEGILVAFGRKRPLELLRAVDAELVKKERRLQALSLLSSFVRMQPPHLHLVMETPILQHLHSCLLIDLSGTVVDLALTVLIMLLPHIASSLSASMSKLFVIYARILCWDQYTAISSESDPCRDDGDAVSPDRASDGDLAGARALEVDTEWQPLDRLFNSLEAFSPKANYLFTFLYGLFPHNFMNFIRKPRRFLRSKNYPYADDLNLYQELIRRRTEAHRVSHRLHPSFFTSTPEDELTDNRLLKMEPTDLVTECLALCITMPSVLNVPGPPPTSKLPDLPKDARKPKLNIRPDALLAGDPDEMTNAATSPTEGRSQSSWRNTQSTTLTVATSPGQPDANLAPPPGAESSREASPKRVEGTSPPKEGPPSRPTSRHREPKSPRSRKTFNPYSDAEPLPKLQVFAQSLSGSPRSNESSAHDAAYSVAILQREVMLLKNDLNFERFQKAQYLAQIGQLQRKNLTEATTESQTQSLLNKNRTLSDKLRKADELYAQLKKETAMSRAQAKKTEEILSQKLRVYRDEEKHRQVEVQRLRVELDATKKECEALRKLVVESENREHDARNELSALKIDLEAMDNLRHRFQELEAKVRQYELSELDAERAREDHDLLQTELETAQLTIQSRDAELDRLRKTYEQKIVALENRIRKEKTAAATATGPPPASDAPLPDSIQQMIDSALAASNAKYAQIKKNYKRLNEKYIELEVKFQELESGRASPNNSNTTGSLRPGSVLSLTRYAEDAKLPTAVSSSGVSRVQSGRRPHAFSDPNALLEEEMSADEDTSATATPTAGQRAPARANTYANKSRFESLAGSRQMPARGISPPPLERPSRSNSFTHDFQVGAAPSQRSSVQALDLQTSRKVAANSEVRVHGRGGAQNIGRKTTSSGKDGKKPASDSKTAKTGGFRGLKGIM
ncbi:uncharacterized protein PV09_07971 [Verruconis gallopava]|uniref:Tuberous sclerosis 1 n=1 Tax=Verruconis gallopava TaxID=253628 RepID=A0A0D2A1A7_9PEZI|nr:uncharacterized protein PV09_07971 [Verruconis gallopava]KIW00443.1 hypothetical protein PV09_07971 [Verruconis gallopava]